MHATTVSEKKINHESKGEQGGVWEGSEGGKRKGKCYQIISPKRKKKSFKGIKKNGAPALFLFSKIV